MRTFLKLICWAGLAASIYYLGFSWWTIPSFAVSLILVMFICGMSENERDNLSISSAFLFGLYLAVVAIYVFSGDDYSGRAIASLNHALYFLNPIVVLIIISVWSADYSSGSRPSHNNYSDDNDHQSPKNYMSPDDRHFRQTQDEMNRQHQEAEDMGYFK